MKIRRVAIQRRRRCFEVTLGSRVLTFPFAKCEPEPGPADPVVAATVDRELAREAFTFALASGREGSVHAEQVLEHHQDPSYLRDQLVYELTLEARRRVARSVLGKREIVRRLDTSATQFYRLLDPTNYSKSIDQMLRLLSVLECDVQLRVTARGA